MTVEEKKYNLKICLFFAVGVGAGGEEQVASLISVFQLLWLALVVAFLFVGTFHLWYCISKSFSFGIILMLT